MEKIAPVIQEFPDWSSLGEQGKRIQKILGDIEKDEDGDDDIMAELDAWQEFLDEHLSFPFNAKCQSE